MTIEVGSTVRFKSGGPLMTVVEIDNAGTALCMYFARPLWQREYFPIATLRLANNTEPTDDGFGLASVG